MNLKKVADNFRAEMLATWGKEFDERPFVIGHPDATRTQIPARDGVAHGNIKRSNRFPNDSFFLNWTRLEDFISWDCEVGKTEPTKSNSSTPAQLPTLDRPLN